MPNPIETYGQKLASLNAQERANTLVSQITDGFLRGGEAARKEADTRPFEELLTHLLPRADLFTRSITAQKLAKRRDLPRRVLALFLQDDAAVVEPLIMHSKALLPEDIDTLIARHDPILRLALLKRDDLSLRQKQALALNIPSLQPQRKAEERPAADEKPLIIDIPRFLSPAQPAEAQAAKAETPEPILLAQPAPAPETAAPHLVQSMVRAAVLRRSEELAALIAKEINLSPIVTQALLKDDSGEALIAACHYLRVPEDASMQIATLLYPAITRTQQQLVDLRKTYRAFTPQATQKIAEAWRTLPYNRAQKHAGVHAGTASQQIPPAPAPIQPQGEKRALNQ
jgi:uncharacterized protein (DUF2336 family)